MISRYQILCALLLFGTVLLYQTMAVSYNFPAELFPNRSKLTNNAAAIGIFLSRIREELRRNKSRNDTF